MQTYNEEELWQSIEASERRLAELRQKRRQQKRRALWGALTLAVVVPVVLLAGIYSTRAPRAPSFVVTWPQNKVQQVVAPNQTLVSREGQPWTLSVTNPARWDVTWFSGPDESVGPDFSWTPPNSASGTSGAEVVAQCRPIVEDWTATFSFLWPTREIMLRSVSAKRTGNYSYLLETGPDGAWVFANVFAAGRVAWDERALSALPQDPLGPLQAVGEVPTEALWRLVSDFEGASEAPATGATFVALGGPDLDQLVPPLATKIARAAPTATVKFVVRLDKEPPEAVFRIAFDGKAERQGWIRRPGERTGTPVEGWQNIEAVDNVPTNSLPQPSNEN